jgi:hypothetical protein
MLAARKKKKKRLLEIQSVSSVHPLGTTLRERTPTQGENHAVAR